MSATGTGPAPRRRTGRHPLAIGLTGGIGSGKSACAALFAELGATVIDADVLAHRLVAPGEPALEQVIAAFGPQYRDARGRLDRGRLRRRVFADRAARHRLESILHPIIRNEIIELIDSTTTPYCIVVIPLLLESGQSDLVDRVLVIDAPRAEQIRRASRRDGLPREEIEAILNTQVDRTTRLAAADDVIRNTGTREELSTAVHALHAKYLELAGGN